jgi:hypothetical protein
MARSDVERGALNEARQGKMRDAVRELVSDLADIEVVVDENTKTTDAEAFSAVEDIPENPATEHVPVLKRRPFDGLGRGAPADMHRRSHRSR